MAMRRKTNKKTDEGQAFGVHVTPKGLAAWAWLEEPVAEGLDKGKQKITVFFSKGDPEWMEFEKKLIAANEEYLGDPTLPACVKAANDYEVENAGATLGQPCITFKCNPSTLDNGSIKPVPIVDAAAASTSDGVWGGDIVRVQCSVYGWEFAGKKGVSCFLRGVQLIQSNRGSTMMFKPEAAAVEAPAESEFSPEAKSIEELLK